MPTFASVARFGNAVDALDRDVERSAWAATKGAAESARNVAIAHARRTAGSDARYSGWVNKPGLDDLQVKRMTRRKGYIVTPTRRSGGPWKVAEQGRHMGSEVRRSGHALFLGPGTNRKTGLTNRTKTGKIRRGRSTSSRWNGYVRARRTASLAVAEMDRRLSDDVGDAGLAAMRRHLDVT